jgi:hypothetical protein
MLLIAYFTGERDADGESAAKKMKVDAQKSSAVS